VQLSSALIKNDRLTPKQHILRCNIAVRRMQTNVIVVSDIVCNLSLQIVQAQVALPSDRFVLARLEKTLDLAVGLRIVEPRLPVRDADKLQIMAKFNGDELRPVVGDQHRLYAREPGPSTLQHHLDVERFNRKSDLVMHDISGIAVDKRRQIDERSPEIDVGNVQMPVPMRLRRLMEAFLRSLCMVRLILSHHLRFRV